MARLHLTEADLEESFVRARGSGGQKVNKTSACVQLRHPASGLEVKVQESRSRETNRYLARERLCQQLEARATAAQEKRQQHRELQRRRHRRPSKNARKRNVQNKRQHGQKKQLRRRPNSND